MVLRIWWGSLWTTQLQIAVSFSPVWASLTLIMKVLMQKCQGSLKPSWDSCTSQVHLVSDWDGHWAMIFLPCLQYDREQRPENDPSFTVQTLSVEWAPDTFWSWFLPIPFPHFSAPLIWQATSPRAQEGEVSGIHMTGESWLSQLGLACLLKGSSRKMREQWGHGLEILETSLCLANSMRLEQLG